MKAIACYSVVLDPNDYPELSGSNKYKPWKFNPEPEPFDPERKPGEESEIESEIESVVESEVE